MRRSNGLQGLIADHDASRREDHADDRRRQSLKTPVPVWVILVSWSRSDAHTNQDDARCEHIASELETRRNDRCRVGQPADDDVAARERSADRHASRVIRRAVRYDASRTVTAVLCREDESAASGVDATKDPGVRRSRPALVCATSDSCVNGRPYQHRQMLDGHAACRPCGCSARGSD